MNPSVREPSGVPFAVRVRAYIPHALTALVAIAAYLLTFAFLAGKTVGAAAELRRTVGAPHNEIVLAGEANSPESFLYLKNYAASGKTGENALSDVLMILPGFEYYSNHIDFCGTLESGTCAVSANVAVRRAYHTYTDSLFCQKLKAVCTPGLRKAQLFKSCNTFNMCRRQLFGIYSLFLFHFLLHQYPNTPESESSFSIHSDTGIILYSCAVSLTITVSMPALIISLLHIIQLEVPGIIENHSVTRTPYKVLLQAFSLLPLR
jgi:hypothetical protein